MGLSTLLVVRESSVREYFQKELIKKRNKWLMWNYFPLAGDHLTKTSRTPPLLEACSVVSKRDKKTVLKTYPKNPITG